MKEETEMCFKKKRKSDIEESNEKAREAQETEESMDWMRLNEHWARLEEPKNRPNKLYDVIYKIKEVGSDNKVKTITKKVTISAEGEYEAIGKFTNDETYERGQVVGIKRLSIKDLRK